MSITGPDNESLKRKKGVLENYDHMYTGVSTVDIDTGRHEKPWQRVPCTLFVLILGIYLLVGYLTQLIEDDMPKVITEASVARDNSDTFSEEAAWRYLNMIIGDEPRVSGCRYHLEKTRELKALVDSVANQATQRVHTDWQIASDDYWIKFSTPHVNLYRNISNVIAVLEGESGFHANGTIGNSLLVNCHYDSVPFALGTSDNAIFCAVMIESLSKLSRRTQKLKHNIIFLFNGAEENGLHASHGFLQHPWARGVKNVINLDAAGMNGKPIVFQVTDPRVLEIYKKVAKRPHGQSVGEFLFATGIIPSDTDFRIWRDFGPFYGLDIAFVKWGHVYHTRYDHPDLVRSGVIQNAGDLLLALMRDVADSDQFDVTIPPSAAVYYDYLNWFFVTLSFVTAYILDVFVVLLGVLTVCYYVWIVGPRWSTVQELLFAVLGRFVSMFAGILTCAILVPIMAATTTQMRYLTEPWIVVPQFWIPYVIAAVCASQAFDAWRTKKTGLNRCIRTLQAQAATRLILTVILLLLLCAPSLTLRYVIAVPLCIMSLLAAASLTALRMCRMTAWMQLIMEVLFSLPSVMFIFSLALRFNSLLLPIMGRTPTNNPDYTIGILNVGLAILASTCVSGIELLFSRKRLWVVGAPLAAVCIIIMLVPFSPYRDDGPSTQRHYWFHSEIVTYDYNNTVTDRVTGVIITKYDKYTLDYVLPALKEKGINVNHRNDFTQECIARVHCGLPLYRARFGDSLKDSLFLYTGGPTPFVPESSVRLNNRTCVGDTCTFNFRMIGPAHNLISIKPYPQANVTAWSFKSPLDASFSHGGRPVYLILESTATYSDAFQPLDFSVTVTVPVNQQSSPIIDLAHHAHKIHHPEEFTPEYSNILAAMPKYFNIASFLSVRSNYIF